VPGFKFKDAAIFIEGLARITLDKKNVFIDRQGRTVIDFKDKKCFFTDFKNGLASGYIQDKNVYINKAGKIIWADTFKDNAIEVKKNK